MMVGRTPLNITFFDEELERDVELVFNHDKSCLELLCSRTNKFLMAYGQHEVPALMVDIDNFALDECDELFLQGYLSCAWGLSTVEDLF